MLLPELEVDESFPRLKPLALARAHVQGGPPVGGPPGAVLDALRMAAVELREEVRASGMPDGVTTRDLVTQPHPTTYGLFRAARSRAPWLWLTDRVVVVTWHDDDGRPRTLIWGPSDHELDTGTAAMRRLRQRLPIPSRLVTTVHGTVPGHLRALGIAPEDVDYVTFDHLHTQDLRRVLGTVGPAADLGAEEALPGWFPNARLLVQRAEWETLRHPHPLQSPWYQSATFASLPPERICVLDGDHLLGPGVALVCTPGHTMGNQSLVLNTADGIQVVSGNGVLAESWMPGASRLPGLRRYTLETGLEVIPRASTLEFASWQYASMVAESIIADRTPDGRFPRILPTGEVHPHVLAPGLRPTARTQGIEHGSVVPSRIGLV